MKSGIVIGVSLLSAVVAILVSVAAWTTMRKAESSVSRQELAVQKAVAELAESTRKQEQAFKEMAL